MGQMKQFGVITYSLDPSQQGIMITKNLNDIVSKYYDISPIVFYREYYQPIIEPLFATMQEVEAWNFPHPIITTDLDTTERSLSLLKPTERYFYVLNLEWLYMTSSDINYDKLNDIYANDNIKLIARSKTHAKILADAWKSPVAIIENFNYTHILELIYGRKTTR